MSHYDCSHCGASMGVAYGSCKSCTPKELFELENKLRTANYDAERAFEIEFAEQIRTLKAAKIDFVALKTRELQDRYDIAYELGKNEKPIPKSKISPELLASLSRASVQIASWSDWEKEVIKAQLNEL